MTSENIDNIVSNLQNKVNTIVKKNNSSNITHIIPVKLQQSSINIKPYVYYAAIPVVLIIIIIIILYFMKPKFIMIKEEDNYRISFKKVIITTFIVCGIIGVGVIGWKYYKGVNQLY